MCSAAMVRTWNPPGAAAPANSPIPNIFEVGLAQRVISSDQCEAPACRKAATPKEDPQNGKEGPSKRFGGWILLAVNEETYSGALRCLL
jgi:hypothetical protein